MAEATFSERLASERRRRNLSISQVSETLRIRPSIIEAMESGTFENMPLKGYVRNMISTYARYLGLDPVAITEQFLREYRQFEQQVSRQVSPLQIPHPQSGDLAGLADGTRAGERSSYYKKPQRTTIHMPKRNSASGSLWGSSANNRYDEQNGDAEEFGAGQGHTQSRRARRQAQKSSSESSHKKYNSSGRGTTIGGDVTGVAGFFLNIVRSLFARPLLMVIILVVIAVLLLILVATAAGSCSSKSVETLPITGGAANSADGISADDVGKSVEEIAAQLAEDAKYGEFELRIVLNEGASWITLVIDGKEVFNDIAQSPYDEVFNVTTSCVLDAAAPGYVKVYRNEQEVTLEYINNLGHAELKVEQKPITTDSSTNKPANANEAAA
ncbi:MAG: helix-turn-helix domain-containing protein [Coriobacteriales bacterium]|nr:helix-turn-helix domain-containing protein [Coriobacteriales bacterium]